MPDNILENNGFNELVKSRYGYLLFNKNDIYIGRGIKKYAEWSEGEVQLFQQICRPGHVVVEVGANIGTHTVPLAKQVGTRGRVHAFEPQRLVFQNLCANIAINSLQNVDCYPMGVSSENGHVLIPEIPYDQAQNFGGINIEGFNQGNKVSIVKLDDFLDLSQLNLLKIDVEGMEQKVIAGAVATIERHKPILYVENDRHEQSRALIELIVSLGYRLYWHLPPLFNKKNFAADDENIFENIVSVNVIGIHNSTPVDMRGFQEVVDVDFIRYVDGSDRSGIGSCER